MRYVSANTAATTNIASAALAAQRDAAGMTVPSGLRTSYTPRNQNNGMESRARVSFSMSRRTLDAIPGVIKSTVTSVVIEIIWIQGDTRRNAAGVIRLISTPSSAANRIAIKIEPLSTAVQCANNPGRIMPNLLSRTAYTLGMNTHEEKLIATTNS